MALATLSIDIEARLARLEQGLEGAVRASDRAARSVDAQWTRAGAALRGAFAATAVVTAVAEFARFSGEVIKGVDKLNDLADATGSTVENLSALEDVALRTGSSIDDAGSILIKFNKALADAKPGSEAEKALRALGLSAEDLRRQDPSEALRQVSQALQRFDNDGTRARYVQELFGKSVKEAAPFLSDLAKQGQLNATVTSDQAAQAEKFNQHLAALNKNMLDVSRTIVSAVLPNVNSFIETMARFTNGPGLGASLLEVFKGNAFTSVQAAFDKYRTDLQDIDARIGRIKSGQENRFNIYGRDFLAELEQSRVGVVKFLDVYRGLLNAGSGGGGRGAGVQDAAPKLPDLFGAAKSGGGAKEAARNFEDYATTVTQSIAKMAEDTPTVKLAKLVDQLKRLDELAAAGFDPQVVRDIRDALQGPTTVEVPQEAADRAKALADVMRVLEETPDGKLNDLVDLEEKLADAQSKGLITAEQMEAGLKVLEDRFDSIGEPAKEALEQMSTFADEAQRNIQRAMGDTLTKALEGDFKNIGDLWLSMIKRMLAEALAADLNTALFAGLKDFSFSGMVSAGASLLGFARGGVFDGGVKAFASGGVFDKPATFAYAGGLGVLGEAGPEAVMPLKRGADGRLGVQASAPAAAPIYINVNPNPGVSAAEMQMAMTVAVQRAVSISKGQIHQSMRRQGVFS